MENIWRVEIELLTRELEETRQLLNAKTQKVVAIKTRNENLNSETITYKLKTLNLLEKSDRDEEYIKCLNEKISITKFECFSKIEEIKLKMEESENIRVQTENEKAEIQEKLEVQEKLVLEREHKIKDLNDQILVLENDLKLMFGDFLFSCKNFSKEQYLNFLKILEKEKEDVVEHVKV